MYKRERIYKSGQDNLEIVQDFRCKIVFYILGVNYQKLLEMVLFIPPKTFWRVRKLHGFGKKLLGILRDALTQSLLCATLYQPYYCCGLSQHIVVTYQTDDFGPTLVYDHRLSLGALIDLCVHNQSSERRCKCGAYTQS